MEPVFMFLAQSAAMALDQQCPVQTINVEILQEKLKNDPLANGSVTEILVDDADIKIITGDWKKETTGGYEPTLLLNNSKQPSGARFEPEIKKKERYQVYFYYPRIQNEADALYIKVYNGRKQTSEIIQSRDIKIVGQTSGEWVNL